MTPAEHPPSGSRSVVMATCPGCTKPITPGQRWVRVGKGWLYHKGCSKAASRV